MPRKNAESAKKEKQSKYLNAMLGAKQMRRHDEPFHALSYLPKHLSDRLSWQSHHGERWSLAVTPAGVWIWLGGVPVVSLRSTTGYRLSSLRDG